MAKDQGQDACSQGTSASQRVRKNRLLRAQPLVSLAASAWQQVAIRVWIDPLRRSLTLTLPGERGQSCAEQTGIAVRRQNQKETSSIPSDHYLLSAEEKFSSATWAAFLAKSYVALRFPPKKRTFPFASCSNSMFLSGLVN